MSSTRLSFLLSAARIPRRIPPSPSWAEAVGRGWATGAVLFFLFLWQLLKRLLPRLLSLSRPLAATTPAASCSPPPSSLQPGDPVAITDADLADLIEELEGKKRREELWEDAVEKKNDLISYNAKSCRQKDGPVKYLSTTTFEKCSTELLRDFYMDNEYRKKWDKTVVEHEQLEVDDVKAIEVGRTIKKFPLLTAREYILIWRLWEGKDCSYYCLIKDYEYPQLPRQKKYVRVRFFKSGWRIKRVPGRDACEITLLHQEDAGLNAEMAKLAFTKGIWNYICKTNVALREYSSWRLGNSVPKSTLRPVPVPHELERDKDDNADNMALGTTSSNEQPETSMKMPAKDWIGKGILLVGGLVCLSHGNPALAAQLAMACMLKKLARQRTAAYQEEKISGVVPQAANRNRETTHEVPLGRWSPRHNTKIERSRSFDANQLSPSWSRTRW